MELYVCVMCLTAQGRLINSKRKMAFSETWEISYSPAVKVNAAIQSCLINDWRLNAILCYKNTIKFQIVLNLPNPFRATTRNPERGYSGCNHKASSHNLYHPTAFPRNSGLVVHRSSPYYYLCS